MPKRSYFSKVSRAVSTVILALCAASVFAQEQPTSLSEVVAKVGSDTLNLSNFVHEEISIEPFIGILRTPEQTLAIRRGSVAERAALLAALLQTTGSEAVVFNGTPTRQYQEESLSKLPKSNSVDIFVQPISVQNLLAETLSIYDRVGDALHEVDITPVGSAHLPKEIGNALATPFWVETGRKQILDESGIRSEPLSVERLEAIDHLKHHISLAVRLTSESNGKVIDENILETRVPITEVDAGFVGLHMERSEGIFKAILSFSGREIASRPIVYERKNGVSSSTKSAFGGLGGALGNLTAPKRQTTRPVTSRPIALTLSYSLEGPTSSIEGDFEVWRIKGQDSDGSQIASSLFAATAIVLDTGVDRDLAEFLPPKDNDLINSSYIARMIALPPMLMQSYRALLPPSIAGSPLLRTRSGPGLVIAHIGAANDGTISLGLSIEEKGHTLIAPVGTDLQASDLFYERVFAGILDAVVERAALSPSHWDEGIVSLFEAALFQEIEIIANEQIAPDLSPRLLRQAIHDGRVVVRPNSIPLGFEKSLPSWWEIDPISGQTLDANSKGRHASFIEYKSQNKRASSETSKMRQFVCVLAVVLRSVASEQADLVSLVNPEKGLVLKSLAGAFLSISKTSCKNTLNVPEAAKRVASAGARTAGKGFRPLHRILTRKPWRPNGPTFPRRGR